MTLTELITHAIKYGEGDVMVSLSVGDDGAGELVVEDEGPGFPDGFTLGQGAGLGSKPVTSLLRPEDGSIAIDRSVGFGRVVLTVTPNWRKPEPT
ncbi:MAG: hypothetical protein NTZ14_09010 [Hyphomicrobiales bacterium]|nr:hypothetical protein [Hyphomicrobiales bacterium]